MLGDTRLFRVIRYLAHNEAFTIAVLQDTTGGEPRIGMTWNPDPSRPSGYPNSRGRQQWFVLHQKLTGHFEDNEGTIRALIGDPPKKPKKDK